MHRISFLSPRNILGRFNFDRYGPILIILFVIFPLGLLYGRMVYAPSDDMYIFLVYARNFLNGHGLTFNGAVVQGYTSILWVVLLCIFGLTRLDLVGLAITLSVVSGLLVLFATYYLSRKLHIGPFWALLPVILVAATGDFAYYLAVGLEQLLFTAFVAGGVALVYSQDPRRLLNSLFFPAFLALMVYVRPEGALVAGLFLVILGIAARSFRTLVRCGFTLAVMLAPVYIACRIYYGYWLPNTYYIKSNSGLVNLPGGISYLIIQSWSYAIVLAGLLFLICYCLVRKKFALLKNMWPVALVVIVWVIYVAFQGGDNLVGGRLLLPVMPLVYVVLIKVLTGFNFRNFFVVASAVLISLGLVIGYLSNPIVRGQVEFYRQWFVTRVRMGMYLHDHFPPGTLVALDPAGIIPYYSQLPTIDMLGLNDVHIAHFGERDYTLYFAHQAGDGPYVLSRKPDIILFGASGASRDPEVYISDREIWSSPVFQNGYKLLDLPGIGYAYINGNTLPK